MLLLESIGEVSFAIIWALYMQPCMFCKNANRKADGPMKLNSRKLWYESGHSEKGGMIPHQVCQVGLVSTHELPLLANGSNPVVNRFVEILPDILLQVVPRQKEKYKSSFKKYT